MHELCYFDTSVIYAHHPTQNHNHPQPQSNPTPPIRFV